MSQAANMYDQWLAYTPGKCIVMGKRKWKKTQTGLVLVSHS
ncbi:MAG: hypothetical protein U9Q15_05610 [Patescibacteria group bacterium]|nr:hypothetical protein [Patescibacteria group bacterium]